MAFINRNFISSPAAKRLNVSRIGLMQGGDVGFLCDLVRVCFFESFFLALHVDENGVVRASMFDRRGVANPLDVKS